MRQLGYDALGTSRRSVTANGVETVHSSVSLRLKQVLAVNVKASFIENRAAKNSVELASSRGNFLFS